MKFKTIGMLVWGVFTAVSVAGFYGTYTGATNAILVTLMKISGYYVPIPVIGAPFGYIVIWVTTGMILGYLIQK